MGQEGKTGNGKQRHAKTQPGKGAPGEEGAHAVGEEQAQREPVSNKLNFCNPSLIVSGQ